MMVERRLKVHIKNYMEEVVLSFMKEVIDDIDVCTLSKMCNGYGSHCPQ